MHKFSQGKYCGCSLPVNFNATCRLSGAIISQTHTLSNLSFMGYIGLVNLPPQLQQLPPHPIPTSCKIKILSQLSTLNKKCHISLLGYLYKFVAQIFAYYLNQGFKKYPRSFVVIQPCPLIVPTTWSVIYSYKMPIRAQLPGFQ